ncbi:MAG: hypothetical protein J5I99_08920 [Verrucomicrobia bacterium]|nr:hypothetical protein [Verrucomicrobiota bacterium]
MKARRLSPAKRTRSRPLPIDKRYPAGGLRTGGATVGVKDGTLSDIPPVAVAPWYDFAVPTWSQRFSDCVAHATVNAIEMLYRRAVGKQAIPAGMQLDPVPIYKHARAKNYPAERWDEGGLLLHHGYLSAVALGYLPPGSRPGLVDLPLGAVCHLLVNQPILQGTATHGGWRKPNPANGQIPIRGWIPNPFAGHATVLTAVLEQRGRFYVQFLNSHGADWGYHGYGMFRADQWQQNRMGPLCLITLPAGWEQWTGWKDYLIVTPR